MWWCWVLIGCSGDGKDVEPDDAISDADADADADSDTDTDSDADADTADTGGGAGVASCALSPLNPLRVECTATLSSAATATLVLASAGLPTRTFVSDTSTTDHALLGWGLKADTVYDWSLAGAAGQVATGPLDADLQQANIAVTGTAPAGFDAVLQPLACDTVWFVMIDPDGDIVWYEPSAAHQTRQDGYTWSQADRSVMSIGQARMVEQHVSGAELLRLERGVDYDGLLHHDLTRWQGLTYLLYERAQGSQNVDGIHVFDGTTQVGNFYLDDHYPCDCTGMGDWSHGNGLNITDTGELVLSLLQFDGVLGIDGDPASATFLQPTFLASGLAATTLPGPDYLAPTAPGEGWERQHNASLLDGDLYLFDNSSVPNQSRGLRLTLDAVSGEARVDAEWRLDKTCLVHGGALPIDGGVLLSCATDEEVYAFEESATTAAWTLSSGCTSSELTMTHALPVRIE